MDSASGKSIPESEIAAAREVPIEDTWARLGLPDLGRNGLVCSPFREDKNPSLQVGGSKNTAHDFATGQTFDTIDIVRRATGCGFREAVEFCLGRAVDVTLTGEVSAAAARPANGAAKKPTKEKPKRFPSAAEGLAFLESKCLRAREDAEALAFLKSDYGLDPEDVPADCWVISDKGQKGLAYVGRDAAGEPVSVHFKSFSRGAEGKRSVRYLAGNGGAIFFDSGEPGGSRVLACGFEKGAAIRKAGFDCVAFLTGETAKPSTDWLSWIVERGCAVAVAHDADQAGADGTAAFAQALAAAGLPAERLYAVQWPDGTPKGHDVNDVLKAEGADALGLFLTRARQWQPDPAPGDGGDQVAGEDADQKEKDNPWAAQLLSVADAFAEREPVRHLIHGFLPAAALVGVVSPEGQHKTNLTMDGALAIASGGRFLQSDGDFGLATTQARVLWINADTGTCEVLSRVEAFSRARRLGPDFDGFRLLSFPEPMLDLSKPKTVTLLMGLIETGGFGMVVLDSLTQFRAGADENDAAQMTLVMAGLRSIVERTGATVVFLHHKAKHGTGYRGSTVIASAVDAIINVQREGESDEIEAFPGKVRGAPIQPFRALFHWRAKPNSWELEWARFSRVDGDQAQSDEAGPTVGLLRAVLADGRRIKRADLVSHVMSETGVKKTKAYDFVGAAIARGDLQETGRGLLCLPEE